MKKTDDNVVLAIWGAWIVVCIGINAAFLYLLWRLGWAAVEWLSR